MKKIFTLVFACVTALAALAQTGDASTPKGWGLSGSGTEADPYQIKTADDFAKMASNCTADHKGTGEYFKMVNDIDFGGKTASPVQLPAIGKDGKATITKIAFGFDGTFDGDNHTIKGIYHTNNGNDAEGKYNGLFGCIDKNGVVKNIIMGQDNYIESYNYVGTIASLNMGKIENCVNKADITASNAFAGGICAYLVNGCGTIEKCKNYGNISAMSYAAGICGGSQSRSSITSYAYLVNECENHGNMSTKNGLGSAGIAGAYSGTVKKCTNYGNIDDTKGTAKSKQYTAGIVSCPSYAVDIDGCVNNGTVNGVNNVAGIVGNVMKGDGKDAAIKNCTNNGAVSGQDYVAGIVGNSAHGEGKVSVEACTNNGEVSSTAETANIGNLRGSENIALGNGNVIAGTLPPFALDNPNYTAISNVVADKQGVKNGKYIRNGRVVIINGDKEYTIGGIKL